MNREGAMVKLQTWANWAPPIVMNTFEVKSVLGKGWG